VRFPSLSDVARELRDVSANVEGECEVRLQVFEDGDWVVRWGDPSYDPSHHGFWGAASVPGVVEGRARRFDSTAVARDLLEQAREQAHEAALDAAPGPGVG
jgi:hypothetical protein